MLGFLLLGATSNKAFWFYFILFNKWRIEQETKSYFKVKRKPLYLFLLRVPVLLMFYATFFWPRSSLILIYREKLSDPRSLIPNWKYSSFCIAGTKQEVTGVTGGQNMEANKNNEHLWSIHSDVQIFIGTLFSSQIITGAMDSEHAGKQDKVKRQCVCTLDDVKT